MGQTLGDRCRPESGNDFETVGAEAAYVVAGGFGSHDEHILDQREVAACVELSDGVDPKVTNPATGSYKVIDHDGAAKQVMYWEVCVPPGQKAAHYVSRCKDMKSEVLSYCAQGMIVKGFDEGDWVALADIPGYISKKDRPGGAWEMLRPCSPPPDPKAFRIPWSKCTSPDLEASPLAPRMGCTNLTYKTAACHCAAGVGTACEEVGASHASPLACRVATVSPARHPSSEPAYHDSAYLDSMPHSVGRDATLKVEVNDKRRHAAHGNIFRVDAGVVAAPPAQEELFKSESVRASCHNTQMPSRAPPQPSHGKPARSRPRDPFDPIDAVLFGANLSQPLPEMRFGDPQKLHEEDHKRHLSEHCTGSKERKLRGDSAREQQRTGSDSHSGSQQGSKERASQRTSSAPCSAAPQRGGSPRDPTLQRATTPSRSPELRRTKSPRDNPGGQFADGRRSSLDSRRRSRSFMDSQGPRDQPDNPGGKFADGRRSSLDSRRPSPGFMDSQGPKDQPGSSRSKTTEKDKVAFNADVEFAPARPQACWSVHWFPGAARRCTLSDDALTVTGLFPTRMYSNETLPAHCSAIVNICITKVPQGGACTIGIARQHCKSLSADKVNSNVGRGDDSVALVLYTTLTCDIEMAGEVVQEHVYTRISAGTIVTVNWNGPSGCLAFAINGHAMGHPVSVPDGADYVYAVGLKEGSEFTIVNSRLLDR